MKTESGNAITKGAGRREAWGEKLQFLSDSMEVTSQPFVAGDPDGTLRIFNEAYCRLTGYGRDELENVSWSETLTTPGSRQHEIDMLKRLEETGEPQRYEKDCVRKDGTVVPVELFTHIARDGNGRTLFYYAFITDISERRRSEEALRRSQTLLAAAERMSHTGAWEWDLATDQWTFSDEWLSIHGCRARTLTPEELLAVAHPDDRDRVRRALDDARLGKKPCGIEHRIVRRDNGEVRTVRVYGETVRDARGRPVKVRGVARDVTEHRRMDELLHKANRAYKVLAKCNQALIHAEDEAALLEELCRIIVDLGGYRLAWIGYVEDDAAGTVRPVARAGHDEGYVDNLGIALNDPVTGRGPTATSLKTGKPVATMDIRSEDSMKPWREAALARGYRSTLNLPVMRDGQSIGTVVIYSGDAGAFCEEEQGLMFELADNLAYGITAIRDRTRRIRAEEELRRSLDRLESRVQERTAELQRSNEELTIQIEERRRAAEALEIYRLFSENTRDIVLFVRRDGKILEANEAAIKAYGYAREELHAMSVYDLRASDPGFYVDEQMETAFDHGILFEALHRRKDGTVFPVEVSSQGRHIKGQKVLLSVVRDITERKQAEDTLKEAKARAELYVDLMGHDINNMNNTAMGYLELALETLATDKRLKPEDKVLLEKPLQAIKSSSMLIDNVRKLQRLMTEGVRTGPIDLRQLFSEIDMESLRPGDREVAIRVRDIPHYRVEANELLRDVFINLISNAIKHSGEEKPLNVDVSVRPITEGGRAYYRCVVEDDGPGIPDEMKGRLFHRFQRGATRARGKGLGLYLVRKLVESYHGKVLVEDRVPGDHTKGARFVVTLPAAQSP
ncbi:MAG: putative diguanylate cyclase [Methanocella sp. PtaU1.Bin125]|nr:MAG: putative diguanylate cyclase [Methanocella sp. PtaU1.Bin125]